MKLSFHGAKYEAQPLNLEITEGEVGGIYRGSPWRIHRCLQKYRGRQFQQELTYRGVTYLKK